MLKNGPGKQFKKRKYISGLSGGLPTRPTRPGRGAPRVRGPPRLGSPKVWGPQGSPAQWPQRAGAHKAWKSPRVEARGVWEGVSGVSMDTPVLKSHMPSWKKINSSWKKIGGKSFEEKGRK
jgi:hypothetical protein